MRTLLFVLAFTALASARTPNVVIIFVDDMGYGDAGCYGATGWKTPHLDQLAKDGMRFTDFHVSQPVCSASRASLMTGCYANRIGIHGALNGSAKVGINANETTLAEVFKTKGYRTGAAGKWHLGHHPQFLPTRHGFDSWLGLPYSNDMWPKNINNAKHPPLFIHDGEKPIVEVDEKVQETFTRRYTERAVKFIDESKGQPFFFYLAHSMPHVPLFQSSEWKGKSSTPYGDVIQEIDWSVGQVLDALKRNGVEQETLVIFTSDNGPWLPYGNHGGTSGGLREGKGTVWEGGTREPCLMKWPGIIPAGSVCDETAMTIDVLPTLAKLIGAELPKQTIDGLDIMPLMKAEPGAKCPHESFAFYYRQNQLQAVRSGPWKLILPHEYPSMKDQTAGKDGRPGKAKQVKIEKPELYNLATDRNETTDVAAKNPEVMAKMQTLVEQYRNELGDSLTKRQGKGVREPGREN